MVALLALKSSKRFPRDLFRVESPVTLILPSDILVGLVLPKPIKPDLPGIILDPPVLKELEGAVEAWDAIMEALLAPPARESPKLIPLDSRCCLYLLAAIFSR